ncbi:MAG TPA: hypothetical protein VGF30_13805, partial [Bacteroidia bacterium]
MCKYLLNVFLFLIVFKASCLKAQNIKWGGTIRGANDQEVSSIIRDSLGNQYVFGVFTGTTDFDPGPGVHNLTSPGAVYIMKLDKQSNFLWVKTVPTNVTYYLDGGSEPKAGIDQQGNLYYVAAFGDVEVDFDPGAGTYLVTPNFYSNIYISKLTPDGDLIWTRGIGKNNDGPNAIGFAIDSFGNTYLTGSFGEATVDFNPDPAVFNNMYSSGETDIYFLKLDMNGNFVWTKKIGTYSYDHGEGISVDAAGNIYAIGSFSYYVNFSPNAGGHYLGCSSCTNGRYLLKMDTDGNYLWATDYGNNSSDINFIKGVKTDTHGHVYITGSDGNGRSYISKITSGGGLVWTKTFANNGI